VRLAFTSFAFSDAQFDEGRIARLFTPRKCDYLTALRSNCDLLTTRRIGCRDLVIALQCAWSINQNGGSIMAKRKKRSKAQKPTKLQRSAKRGKARKAAKAAKATKSTVTRAKPKPAPVKKAAPKVNARKVKRPVTSVVETVAVEVIEQPAPGVITVTEVEETRKAS
jgi:hypothetical protein